MKDAFKKGFGVVMGMYCASVVIYTIQHLNGSKETEKDSKDEEES